MTDWQITQPKKFEDERGTTVLFPGLWERQLVYSESKKNVLKGLHYQTDPWCHKCIYVIKGKIFDVMVDLNDSFMTFGKWTGNVVEAPDKLFCDIGYAHGYLALEDSVILYEFLPFWHYPSTVSLLWNDPKLHIPWHAYGNPNEFIISERDANGLSWDEILNRNLVKS